MALLKIFGIALAVIVCVALICIFAVAILLWAYFDENYKSVHDEFHVTVRGGFSGERIQ